MVHLFESRKGLLSAARHVFGDNRQRLASSGAYLAETVIPKSDRGVTRGLHQTPANKGKTR